MTAAAQVQAELGPFVGYRFGGALGDNANTSYGIGSAVSYGGVVDLDLRRDLGVEFLWSHQSSELALRDVLEPGPFKVNVDHWMVGPWKAFGQPAARIRPFASFLLGISQFSTSIAEGESRARFALAGALGCEVLSPTRASGSGWKAAPSSRSPTEARASSAARRSTPARFSSRAICWCRVKCPPE